MNDPWRSQQLHVQKTSLHVITLCIYDCDDHDFTKIIVYIRSFFFRLARLRSSIFLVLLGNYNRSGLEHILRTDVQEQCKWPSTRPERQTSLTHFDTIRTMQWLA